MQHPGIELSPEERDILSGRKGALRQKLLRTVVLYAQALKAPRLEAITGMGHFVITHALPGISPSLEMLEDLVAADLKTSRPFTLDPPAPLDFDNWWLDASQVALLQRMYRDQSRYTQCLEQLGLWSGEACTCTPYLPEIGNRPRQGDILAWSESACVVFANSVLGARTNRNGAIMDLISNIVGKTPFCGLLTDAGRRATRRITVDTKDLPLPQYLGAALGRLVLGEVPYIFGLDRWLGQKLTPDVCDYLHDMGAACAATGAVGLFHVEGLTPEALDQGEDLLAPGCSTVVLNDQVLSSLQPASKPYGKQSGPPDKCFLGCPHLSLDQLLSWAGAIFEALESRQQGELAIRTTLCAAPQVLARFTTEHPGWPRLRQAGVRCSPGCPMQVFDNDLSAGDTVITNSVKLSTYTEARYVPDFEILEILINGTRPEGQ